MDHVVAPLDDQHARVVTALSRNLASALSIDVAGAALGPPHITLVSYSGIDAEAAALALVPTTATTPPLAVRAHGYGIFTGDADTDLSLHVMVVRTPEVNELQRRVHVALAEAGASLAGTTQPDVWTPHITLLDRGLTPSHLGRAVELLAGRPHRRWSITIGTLAIARRRGGVDTAPCVLPLGTVALSAPPS